MYPVEPSLAEQNDYCDFLAAGIVYFESTTRIFVQIIGWSYYVGRFLDMSHHIALVVDTFASGQAIDAEFAEIDGMVFSGPVPTRRTIASCDDEIDPSLFSEILEKSFYCIYSRGADDFAEIKYSHGTTIPIDDSLSK